MFCGSSGRTLIAFTTLQKTYKELGLLAFEAFKLLLVRPPRLKGEPPPTPAPFFSLKESALQLRLTDA